MWVGFMRGNDDDANPHPSPFVVPVYFPSRHSNHHRPYLEARLDRVQGEQGQVDGDARHRAREQARHKGLAGGGHHLPVRVACRLGGAGAALLAHQPLEGRLCWGWWCFGWVGWGVEVCVLEGLMPEDGGADAPSGAWRRARCGRWCCWRWRWPRRCPREAGGRPPIPWRGAACACPCCCCCLLSCASSWLSVACVIFVGKGWEDG